MIIDLEGGERLSDSYTKIIRPEDIEHPLELNILKSIFTGDPTEEPELITRAFGDALRYTPRQTQIFWEAVRLLRQRGGLGDTERALPPIFALIAEIQKNRDPLKEGIETSILLKQLLSLSGGRIGKILNTRESIKIEEAVEGITLIELGDLKNNKAKKIILLLILALLTRYIDREASEEGKRSPLLVIQGIGSIPPSEMDEDMLLQSLMNLKRREISILFVQRSPREIPNQLVEDCEIRICHRLSNRGDQDPAQKILNLTKRQAALLEELTNREAILKTKDYTQPLIMWIPNKSLIDKEVTRDDPKIKDIILEIIVPETDEGIEETESHSSQEAT